MTKFQTPWRGRVIRSGASKKKFKIAYQTVPTCPERGLLAMYPLNDFMTCESLYLDAVFSKTREVEVGLKRQYSEEEDSET